jgi:flagellar protein FlbD
VITLSRLNGITVAINPDLITWVEVTPDTTISLLGGEKIIVRESLDDVVARVIEFRRAIAGPRGETSAYPPSEKVMQSVSARRDAATSTERISVRPGGHGHGLGLGHGHTTPPGAFRK